MGDPLRFTHHLRQIVAPVLKAHGFTPRGQRFRQIKDGLTAEFEFVRGRWNMPGSCRFSVQVNARHGEYVLPTTSLLPFATLGPWDGWHYRDEAELEGRIGEATVRIIEVGLLWLERLRAIRSEPEPWELAREIGLELTAAEQAYFRSDSTNQTGGDQP